MAKPLSSKWLHAGIVSLLLGIFTGLWIAPSHLGANAPSEYFATTGHTLDNTYGFLSYWRDHNGTYLLGAPVTEVLTENDLTVQYFEYGRLELHADIEGAPIMQGRVGAEYAEALWRTFDAPPPRMATADEQVFEATGHTLREPFLSFWNANGGMETFGYPISEPLWEYVGNQMLQVQYFERGRLEQHPLANGNPEEIRISSLGQAMALMRGYDTAPVANPETLVEEVAAPVEQAAAPVEQAAVPVEQAVVAAEPVAAPVEQAAAPAPVEPVAAPAPVEPVAAPVEQAAAPAPAAPQAYTGGGKRIVVNLSAQWLYAYEGDVMVFDAPVSTGKDGFNTPAGNFAVYSKTPSQTMSGTLGGEYYNVPNVPSVMYIHGGVALHGTYWHNMFGSGVRVSHGCINLPMWSAAWLYDWAPMGTPVTVTY